MEKQELEPCPFCGEGAEMKESYQEENHSVDYGVQCSKCWAIGETFNCGNLSEAGIMKRTRHASSEAIKAWNTRTL